MNSDKNVQDKAEPKHNIGSKIRGLKSPDQILNQGIALNTKNNQSHDDSSRTVLIEGCGCKVPKQVLFEAMSVYGLVVSNVVEQTFVDGSDPSSDGSNRTGFYAKFRQKSLSSCLSWVKGSKSTT